MRNNGYLFLGEVHTMPWRFLHTYKRTASQLDPDAFARVKEILQELHGCHPWNRPMPLRFRPVNFVKAVGDVQSNDLQEDDVYVLDY